MFATEQMRSLMASCPALSVVHTIDVFPFVSEFLRAQKRVRRLCLSYNALEDAQRVSLFRQIASLHNVEEFVFLEFISPETDVVAGYEELFKARLRLLEVRY